MCVSAYLPCLSLRMRTRICVASSMVLLFARFTRSTMWSPVLCLKELRLFLFLRMSSYLASKVRWLFLVEFSPWCMVPRRQHSVCPKNGGARDRRCCLRERKEKTGEPAPLKTPSSPRLQLAPERTFTRPVFGWFNGHRLWNAPVRTTYVSGGGHGGTSGDRHIKHGEQFGSQQESYPKFRLFQEELSK